MMVAGMEFTITTSRPYSFRARHTCVLAYSNYAACPMMIDPEPITSTFLISCLNGIFDQPFLRFYVAGVLSNQSEESFVDTVEVFLSDLRFRNKLHRHRLHLRIFQTLAALVIDVQMADGRAG